MLKNTFILQVHENKQILRSLKNNLFNCHSKLWISHLHSAWISRLL